jgi:hypothetical protein
MYVRGYLQGSENGRVVENEMKRNQRKQNEIDYEENGRKKIKDNTK